MKPKDMAVAAVLAEQLDWFAKTLCPLPGLVDPTCRQVFMEQLIESVHRVKYVGALLERPLSPSRADPRSPLFDPIKGAVSNIRSGNREEAFWLVFLFVHFGLGGQTRWRLLQDVYGALEGEPWTWERTASEPEVFKEWLGSNRETLRGGDGIKRRFGNHRKYESLDPVNGTGRVVESYIDWVQPHHTHDDLVAFHLTEVGNQPELAFASMYTGMQSVHRFGRTARFDYLSMLGKLGMAEIRPGSPYLAGAKGPIAGARLLFGTGTTAELDALVASLSVHLPVPFGNQVLEDALCNWQKSPRTFCAFRG